MNVPESMHQSIGNDPLATPTLAFSSACKIKVAGSVQ
jgi:hypothetical protein